MSALNVRAMSDAEIMRCIREHIAELRAENARLKTANKRLHSASDRLGAHIAEHIKFAETRIKDGTEMGATAWRLALEDIVRESKAVLAKAPPPEHQ